LERAAGVRLCVRERAVRRSRHPAGQPAGRPRAAPPRRVKFLFPCFLSAAGRKRLQKRRQSESGTSWDFPGSPVSEDRKLDERSLEAVLRALLCGSSEHKIFLMPRARRRQAGGASPRHVARSWQGARPCGAWWEESQRLLRVLAVC
jgi:hypothetical protein